jgi:hypothetical protein
MYLQHIVISGQHTQAAASGEHVREADRQRTRRGRRTAMSSGGASRYDALEAKGDASLGKQNKCRPAV